MRQAIDLDMEVEEVLAIMSEGDPQALYILTEILQKNQQGPQIILDLDDMNIRGRQITVGCQQVCLKSIKRFVQMVYNRSPWLVDEINKEVWTNRAVTDGASEAPEGER